MMIVFTACQPESDSASTLEESTMESAPAEPVTGGIIVSGDLQGNEFSIATGEVVDNFLAMVEAFNKWMQRLFGRIPPIPSPCTVPMEVLSP